jgi:maltose 6'-phosphate phosphatase
MRTLKRSFLTLIFAYVLPCMAAPSKPESIRVRVAAYNVEYGKSTTPEQVGQMFKPYELDMIGFNEVPDGDWTARVGKVLGMSHSFVGKISSANHKDKYKSILSRTPLTEETEHEMRGKRGWNPASAVRAVFHVNGVPLAFYSLHICKSGATGGHAQKLATQVLAKEKTERVIVLGDFNNNIGDPAIKTIEGAGYISSWKGLGIDVSKEYSYNAFDPKKNLGVIDHIFYTKVPGAEVTDGGIIELKKPLSDHKPVWAEIVFP